MLLIYLSQTLNNDSGPETILSSINNDVIYSN